MIIKTITCHNVFNYGAVLQEYALIEHLKQQGHEVEAINYQPPYLKSNFGFLSVENPKYDLPIVRWLYRLLKFPVRLALKRRQREFLAFNQQFIPQTEVIYDSNQALKDFMPSADVFITGSDQIWNPLVPNGSDPAFYLDFANKEATKVSYAASFATANISQQHLDAVKPYLEKLDAISVREASGVDCLNNYFDSNKVDLVLDPVFLLDTNHWRGMALPYHNYKPFILIYDFENDPQIEKIAKTLAAINQWEILALNQKIDYADANYFYKGPLQFLSLFQSASLVLTNSYHGLVFALQFEKPFYTFNRKDQINARMHDLLVLLDLEHCEVNTSKDVKELPIVDFDSVRSRLHTLKEFSRTFLGKHLVKKQSIKKQKELLFVIESLSLGGAEKSLTVLLNNLDVNQYQLTILLFVKHGIFLKNIPASVNVMYHPNLRLRLRDRILFKVSKILNLERFHAAQWFWSLFGISYYNVPKTFDVAIAYGQGFATYYCATRVQANKKIAWVNTDYHKAGYHANIDLTYYQRFDDIVAVSDVALESFRKSFNQADLKAQRLHAIQDILDVELIRLMSNDIISFNYQENKFKLITVCRLSKEKGLDMAVNACVELKKKGLHFQWLVLGDGPMLNQLQAQIIKHEIQNELILLGAVPNPYPYMKQADVYVQTSYFEGFGIALHEAAALKLPLVATDIPAANALVRHELNGLICASNANSIAQSIMRLYQSPDLHKKMYIELENYQSNKKQSLHLINQLFND